MAGIETINQFHNQLYRDQGRTGLGNFDNNIMRLECDAAGDMVKLDFKVDCLINRKGQIASLYAGPFRATHAAGAAEGKEHYGIPFASGYDIVVSNAYGKANESAIALLLALMTMKPGGRVRQFSSPMPRKDRSRTTSCARGERLRQTATARKARGSFPSS